MTAGATSLYARYFQSLLDGDTSTCIRIVQSLLDDGIEIPRLYREWFERSLYQVGDMWERNEVSVATEHMATAMTERLLSLVYPYLFTTDRPYCKRQALVTCAVNEHHQIGARMVADIIETHGWHTLFLGANIPSRDLLGQLDAMSFDLLVISLSVSFNLSSLMLQVETVRNHFSTLPIVVGGQGFRWGGQSMIQKIPNCDMIVSIDELTHCLGSEADTPLS